LESNLHEDASLSNLFANLDRSKFAQVIRNLLSNALKFTPPGGIVAIKTTVTPCPSMRYPSHTDTVARLPASQEQLLTIEVMDSGAGISKVVYDPAMLFILVLLLYLSLL